MSKVVLIKLEKLKLLVYSLVILMIFVNFLSILLKYVNKITFDEVFYHRNIYFLLNKMIYIIVAIMLLMLCGGLLNNYLSSKLYTIIDSRLKIDFYKNIMYSEYLFFKNTSASNIYYRMFSDLNIFSTYIIDIFINIPVKIIYLIVCSIFMFKWSPLLSCIYYCLLLVNIFCIVGTKKYVDKISTCQREIEQKVIGFVNEDFSKIGTIKSCGIESWKISEARKKFNFFSKIQVKNKFLLTFFEVINHFTENIWSILYIIIGAYLVYNNEISVGAFVSFVSMTASVSAIAYSLLNSVYLYPQAKICYMRYAEYIKNRNKLEFSGEQSFEFNNELRVNNLTYCYPDSKIEVLKDISFAVKPGSIVRINGENGIGKTTLENILARWIAYDKYEIIIDNKNIFDILGSDYKKNVGYLCQSVDVFNATFIDNIVLDREQVALEYVQQLIDQINMRDTVQAMPNGINTYVGEGGYQLSAGNIQKLGIIRTLAANPRIVLLDEPTENLDTKSKECLIQIIKDYVSENQGLVFIITHDNMIDSLASDVINL